MKDQRMIDIPDYFPWWIFLLGMIFGTTVFVRRVLKVLQNDKGK
jgi:hypothetical protein